MNMNMYFGPEEADSPECTKMDFLSTDKYLPDNSGEPLLLAESYPLESMDICTVPEQSDPSNIWELLPAKAYSPEEDLSLHPIPDHLHHFEHLELLPAKTYSPESPSIYESDLSPNGVEPNDHSSVWGWPVGPEQVAEYQDLAKYDSSFLESLIDDAIKDFMPNHLPSIAESAAKSSDANGFSIKKILSPESCSPGTLTGVPENWLIPAKLNVPLKRVAESQPNLVDNPPFKRPCSRAASIRSVGVTQEAKRPSKTRPVASKLNIRLSPSRRSSIAYFNGDNEVENPFQYAAGSDKKYGAHKKLFGNDGFFGPLPDSERVSLKSETSPKPPLTPGPIPASIPKSNLLRGLSKRFRKQPAETVSLIPPIHAESFTNHKTKDSSFRDSLMGTLIAKSPISVDPSCQAKLYSDIEVMICTAANKFLLRQYYDGRLSHHSVNKVLQKWGSKNRAPVFQFHFDQNTQRELILENRCTLDINCQFTSNEVQFDSRMQSWKAITKDMSTRTFCLPDEVIRKHLSDFPQILDMLDAPTSAFDELNELSAWAQCLMLQASLDARGSKRR
ncbi:hypothetical protein N7466_002120 [Penicillium verhagenii]|uniref:uncharacterized protein n=1 Tax=Penicillium verhagenii TaxID=1562060 RepID=UPI0025453A9A|nr:uncharacterized protein N7466_002120 [Penicillium verhagenii]KAJ5938986.1 hypothetical protein N7466_002120 [Penicillium verhagenii]